MAAAVLTTLTELGVARAHLIGHSMGGAVALSASLQKADLAASLTLFAPGGVGTGINARLLQRFAAATAENEIAPCARPVLWADAVIPRGLAAAIAAARAASGATPALKQIAANMLDGTDQRSIAPERIAAIDAPIRVIWGEDDHVLPMVNSPPGIVAVHRLLLFSHMPHIEIGRSGRAARAPQSISAE